MRIRADATDRCLSVQFRSSPVRGLRESRLNRGIGHHPDEEGPPLFQSGFPLLLPDIGQLVHDVLRFSNEREAEKPEKRAVVGYFTHFRLQQLSQVVSDDAPADVYGAESSVKTRKD